MGNYKEGEALTSSARWRSNGKNGSWTDTDEGFRYAITGNWYGDHVFSMEKKATAMLFLENACKMIYILHGKKRLTLCYYWKSTAPHNTIFRNA